MWSLLDGCKGIGVYTLAACRFLALHRVGPKGYGALPLEIGGHCWPSYARQYELKLKALVGRHQALLWLQQAAS
jgi:hypothetical protein